MLYPFSESQSDIESETNFQSLNQRGRIQRGKIKRNSRGGSGGSGSGVGVSDGVSGGSMCKNSGSISGGIGVGSGNNVGNNGGGGGGGRVGGGGVGGRHNSTKSSSSRSSQCSDSTCSDGDTSTTTSSGEANLPYPGFPEISLKYLTQDAKPRNWCLLLITNPWFERVSILVILLNCITLGMYQPCVDEQCLTNRCKILQIFDDIIFAFFSLEMIIKMVAMGMYGKNTYLADSWNRLDFFIVLSGAFEYCLHVENLNLTAIRTIRVLRPLRAINRIPSMRILVMLLLDTLPMLGNVLLLCFFVFFIFGIVGVQLWEGILRQRCVLQLPPQVIAPDISFYYEFSKEQDYICTKPEDSGMHTCADLPPYRIGPLLCNGSAIQGKLNRPSNSSCVNWNQYYTNCTQLGGNPFQGTISFDNIGLAWVAIFLVISLEGWTDIMYYVQDAHSFWDWIYFVLLIVIGSFFMINLCLVVIATQFAETKKREMERMRQERARFTSTSTLASSTNNSEPTTCYAEIVKYIGHLWRRMKRRLIKKLRLYKYQRQQRKEGLLPNTTETLTLSPNRIRAHHIKCPRHINGTNIISEQLKQRPGNSTGSLNSNLSGQTQNLSQQINLNDSQISSPDNSEMSFDHLRNNNNNNNTIQQQRRNVNNNVNDDKDEKHRSLLKIPNNIDSDQMSASGSGFLSPPTSTCARRRSSVMFSDHITQHSPPSTPDTNTTNKNNNIACCSTEKMTQTTDGIWQVTLPQSIVPHALTNAFTDYSELSLNDTMTCQELLAFSGVFTVALPTGHCTLDSLYSSLKKPDTINIEQQLQASGIQATKAAATTTTTVATSSNVGSLLPVTSNALVQQQCGGSITGSGSNYIEDFSCCYELHQATMAASIEAERLRKKQNSKFYCLIITIYKVITKIFSFLRKYVRLLVDHKYFQQGILLAILINTLSMGIEYHNQPEGLTVIVETSNIAFSAIFAVEMLLKIIAEGPFKYVANGFNVFDGVIVILSVVELCQEFMGDGNQGSQGSSGLSVLRTFRLLRILKLVRFMPNLRRQLFVMLRTMDNVAVFFSLLILFIFIFSILGMNLFGCKFCGTIDGERQCDRKNFDTLLWALVTVFQILTQEDWNVVLFNGMEKTSHWAALYFVALMTFGNYVLFNLLVAILVEGFSSERNERREREQRELVKAKLREEQISDNFNEMMYEDAMNGFSDSTTTSDSYHEIKNRWHSAEELGKIKDSNYRLEKSNIQKQRILQPTHDYTHDSIQELQYTMTKRNSERDVLRSTDGHYPLKKTYSTKERRSYRHHHERIKNFRPPIITTTAATPQDSPNTTLEPGASFKNWDHINFECIDKTSCQSIPSLLKPPSVLGSTKALDERIFFDRAPPILQTENELQNSNRYYSLSSNCIINNNNNTTNNNNNNNNINNNNNNSNMNNNSNSNINNNNKDTGEQNNINNKTTDDCLENTTTTTTVTTTTTTPTTPGGLVTPITSVQGINNIKRSSSFKKFHRISSKRKKPKTKSESDANEVILNNGRDHSQCNGNNSNQLRRNDSILSSTNRIQNDTRDSANKLSPQNSIKRAPSVRRSSYVINNSQIYQNLNRQNSIKNCQYPINRRRMSSIEHVYEKASKINAYNLENQTIHAFKNSKIDLNKSEKSISNISEPPAQPEHHTSKIKFLLKFLKPEKFTAEREEYSLYMFPRDNQFRFICSWFVNQKWFDNVILLFIALNCITLAMERPNIPPYSSERVFLGSANYVFTVVFAIEMFIKVVATGMFYGPDAYFTSGWNIMDGSLVIISIIDLLMSLISESSPRIFGILRVFRLLRSLRPLRVINRAPGLKLVVQTLLSSLRPIGNIVLICCTFFIIFGILGVQLFKGTFYYCEGENIKGVKNKTDCLGIVGNVWINRKYNFDDLGKALMSLFVLSSRDGWVNIMYTGLDAVGIDQQPTVNFNEWRLLYFIAFILLVGFFVLNMFVGVVVENFHRCREEQEKEEKIRRAAKKALQMDKRRRRLHEPPYYTNYSPIRLFVHNVVTSKYFDLAIAAVIGLNVVTMAMEYYMMPLALEYALKIFNYFFTAVFILEAIMKLVALGFKIYLKDKWNQLDVVIVILSIVGIVLEELETNIIPINPTIIRVMRVLRIARVLKLLKMAKGIRALLDTVMQALPQVGNLGLLFFLLFFIFAALGVELFGRLECSDEIPCQGLGEHAHFANFGMAFLTLFRVATGDNWNGIMKDTLRDECDDRADCVRNCCVSTVIAPIFFVIFVLMAQFVLVNVVVAVLMKHLEESHKQMEEDQDMDTQLERELEREHEFEEDQALCNQLQDELTNLPKRPLSKVPSLPKNFQYSTPVVEKKFNSQRRQTVQYFNQTLGLSEFKTYTQNANIFNEQNSFSEAAEMSFNNDSEHESVAGGGSVVGGGVGGHEFVRKNTRKNNLNNSSGTYRHRLGKQTSFDETKRNEYRKAGYDSFLRKTDKIIILPKCMMEKESLSEKNETVDVNEKIKTNVNAENLKEAINKIVVDNEKNQPKDIDVKEVLSKTHQHPSFNRSFSSDTSSIGKSYLSVPKLQARSRSNSMKQLFKQQALEEDPDMDENSLLLPTICKQNSTDSETLDTTDTVIESNKLMPEKLEKSDNIKKSDSSELLRIISERRRLEKRESDDDFNELITTGKSPPDSTTDI